MIVLGAEVGKVQDEHRIFGYVKIIRKCCKNDGDMLKTIKCRLERLPPAKPGTIRASK